MPVDEKGRHRVHLTTSDFSDQICLSHLCHLFALGMQVHIIVQRHKRMHVLRASTTADTIAINHRSADDFSLLPTTTMMAPTPGSTEVPRSNFPRAPLYRLGPLGSPLLFRVPTLSFGLPLFVRSLPSRLVSPLSFGVPSLVRSPHALPGTHKCSFNRPDFEFHSCFCK
jgi:hypothetical protein